MTHQFTLSRPPPYSSTALIAEHSRCADRSAYRWDGMSVLGSFRVPPALLSTECVIVVTLTVIDCAIKNMLSFFCAVQSPFLSIQQTFLAIRSSARTCVIAETCNREH